MLGRFDFFSGALRYMSYVVMTTVVAMALILVTGFAATCAATIANNPAANSITYGMCAGNNGLQDLGTPSGQFGDNIINC